jgi:hypothetical protein
MAGERAGLWFVTEVEASETAEVIEGGRGSEDVGGGFGASTAQAVRRSLAQRVHIDADELKQQIGNLLAVVSDVFDQASAGTGLALEQVELSVEVSSGGQVSILGSGGKLEGKGGIKLSFRRAAAAARA